MRTGNAEGLKGYMSTPASCTPILLSPPFPCLWHKSKISSATRIPLYCLSTLPETFLLEDGTSRGMILRTFLHKGDLWQFPCRAIPSLSLSPHLSSNNRSSLPRFKVKAYRNQNLMQSFPANKGLCRLSCLLHPGPCIAASGISFQYRGKKRTGIKA